MDPHQFDAFSRSLASRGTRRSALRGIGASGVAAGILTAFGVRRATAADTCSLPILMTTSAGPNAGTSMAGTLDLEIGDEGAIDNGSFRTDAGASFAVVGQVTGRAINLRISSDQGAFTLIGTAEIDLVLCRGDAAGVFGGAEDGDSGTWRVDDGSGSGGSSSGGGGSSSDSGGNSSGGGSTGGSDSDSGNSSGGSGDNGSDCASGVICDGVCCQARDGFTPDAMSCDSGCQCTYTCQSAGCPNGGTGHSFTIGCDSRPNALCGEMCNFPDETSCPDTTCADDQQLDPATCTCLDANACGPGQTNCGTADSPDCRDLSVDGDNCGECGKVCPLGLCTNGACGE